MFTRILLLLAAVLGGPALAAPPAELGPALVNPGYHEQPDWFKQSFLDIREDVQEAAAAGKRVILYFYQDGCPYCKKLLEVNFGLRDIVDKTRRHFDVVAINMWGDAEVTGLDGRQLTEKQFAAAMKVMFTPTLLFLDEQGKVVVRLNGYYPPHKFAAVLDYVAGHLEDKMSFRDYWAQRAPRPSHGKLHRDASYLKPPYRLARRDSGKPLLVMFEQKDCPPCDELHLDILGREASRRLLAGFDVVLLDMWSDTPVQTPGGKDTTASRWARSLGVQYAPTLVMFDAGGREVFRTEAYLKAFHIQSALDYVLSGAYRTQPSFQRFVQARADALEARGIHVDLME
ncbi:MAG TPA: thioredoxin [Gammaproteobacteria bacterium]|nr:thioredoxin [Gammaproteobacteria bacterium]